MCSDLSSIAHIFGVTQQLAVGDDVAAQFDVDTEIDVDAEGHIDDSQQEVNESHDLSIQNSLQVDYGTMQTVLAAAAQAGLGVFSQTAAAFSTLANGMPILNSLIDAPTAIFLDFDGDATTTTQAYDEDGDPTTFNTTEQNNIAEAWRQISTYFAMFDTNVTTVATTKPKAWLVSGNDISGGYSYVNVFPNSKPQSFNQSSNVRTRVSGLAHELGHNFGLSHQGDYDLLGNRTKEYSSGYDSFHGPIMGVDYAQSIHKWFIGHAGSASTLQNDLSVIAGKIKPYQPTGGDGYRADDYGNTIATATALNVSGGSQTISGIIERLNDVDAFSFESLGGGVDIAALADDPSGVDLKLDVFDAAGILLASQDSNTSNDQSITLTLPIGTFYVLVSSHKNYGDVGTYNLTLRSLPIDWTARDIGSVGLEGYAEYNPTDSSYTIAGSGTDIGGTADQMQFAMQTLVGDGEIVARLTSMSNTNAAAKAGVEIREATGTGAKHVALIQSWASGQQLISRATANGATTTVGASTQAFTAKWLKLTRVGNVFTGYVSDDGVVWTLKGTSTVAMNSNVLVGLISTAKDNTKRNVAKFKNVSLTGNLGTPPPTVNSLPAPGNVILTRSTGSDLAIAWNDVSGETGFRVERSTDGVNFSTVTTTAANVTNYDDSGLFGTLRYFYRVKAIDASGASAPSAVKTLINRPNAVTNLTVTSLNLSTTVLNWRDTHGESGYRIESSTDGVTFTVLGTVGQNVPSYTDSGLTTATTFTYRVTPTSTNGDGESADVVGSTRLSKVGGVVFTNVASNSISIKWNNITAETNFRVERSTDGTTFTTLATVAANVLTYTDATVTQTNDYYYRITGTNSLTESVSESNVIFTATPATNALPSPWTATDIGAVNGSGATSYSGGIFKVVSSGAEIGSAIDAFRFTSQPLQGDGSITARVDTLQNTADEAKLGVMIRETLAANAKHVMVSVRPTNGIIMQSRSVIGGTTSSNGTDAQVAPYWVRLTRAGNLFTSFSSSDGVTWTQIGTKTLSMTSSVFVGLVGTANSTTLMNTGTFSNVVVAGNARVVNRRVFYNHSSSTVFGNGSDNPATAIDTTKIALLPGQTSKTSTYTNYVKGLNGLIVDVDGLVNATAADFQFAVWNGSDVMGFVASSIAPIISVYPGVGITGSTRVKIELPDNAIRNSWLRVTVRATANTNLPTNDVFYFGNAVGDMNLGNVGTPIVVQSDNIDSNAVRSHQTLGPNSASITNIYDLNKDGRVDMLDYALTQQNQNGRILQFFTAPVSVQLVGLVLSTTSASSSGIQALNGDTIRFGNATRGQNEYVVEYPRRRISKSVSLDVGSLVEPINVRPSDAMASLRTTPDAQAAPSSDRFASIDEFFSRLVAKNSG
ncbi:MAG: zinc-dependent metalloprotease family protein [Pirellulaceae bacterium]|nr:zinc-dependent metalloprotease family protein [Pirellulaceae bacterium]